MICQSTIRRFDGDASSSLRTAVVPQGAIGLRFVGLVVLDKASGRYPGLADGPSLLVAWAPREVVSDETSTPAQIDAALARPDHVPLLVIDVATRVHGYVSDFGHSFPVVGIQGTAMVLLIRIERIAVGTHGQITLGWEFSSCP
ncbi:hypothetical protein ACNOYE_07405 [Nannocystaceae bacterium ST9]